VTLPTSPGHSRVTARSREAPAPDLAGEAPVTYHHARYDGGRHWFSAEHDGDEIGHAFVLEQQGPGGPHAEIKRLRTNPHYLDRGIGSRLLDAVGEHFSGQELRLKPYPIDEDGSQDEGRLREFYSNRGFTDYQLKEGDPFELYDYMTKRASSAPPADPAGASPAHLRGEPGTGGPGGGNHQDTAQELTAGVSLGSGSRLTPLAARRRAAGTASAARQARPGRRP
jgi:GNAT superfamily N-acetyltransferase